MDENIVPMPSPLDRLADQIRADLGRQDHGREEWIEATLDLCHHLAEARAEIRTDVDFGRWCETQGFDLNPHDRAAAIEMGRHLEQARQVLQVTERRSIRYIYDREFRIGHVAKPPPLPTPQRDPEPVPTVRRKLTPEVRERVAAKLVEGLPYQQIADAVTAAMPDGEGISVTVVKTVKAELDAGGLDLDTSGLSKSRQEQFDRALRAARIKIRAEVEAEVNAEVRKAYEEIFIPHAIQRAEWAERILATHRGLMSRADYRKILSCLHPDSMADPERKARFGEAFQTFRDLEDVLVKADAPTMAGSLPKTVGELLARRRR
jgi:hypothetical protein